MTSGVDRAEPEAGSAQSATIGVDVGGTKILAGVVDAEGQIMARERIATPARDAEATIEAIAKVILALQEAHDGPIEAVGIGVAALVDKDRAQVVFAPNLGWGHVNVAQAIEQRTGQNVVVENDANAAAWGEFQHGAGREFHDAVVITVGTGIGGGLILDGRLRRGAHGMAAEVGHIILVPDGRLCGCGRRGCWEQYASGSALVRVAREFAGERRDEAHLLLSLGDGTPEGIRGRHITDAARAGDRVALDAFADVGMWLGRGMADLTAVLDPEVLIIGGGVSDAGQMLVEPARQEHHSLVSHYGGRPVPSVVRAGLGNDAGVIGAADLARIPAD